MSVRAEPVQRTRRCTFCGYPIPEVPGAPHDVTPGEGTPVEDFCSRTCRQAAVDGAEPFTGRHDYKYLPTGVPVLDTLLPRGIRADSLVLLRGDVGTRRHELQVELAWHALARGEPVVYLSYLEPPSSLVERFFALDRNVIPHLERGRLVVIDCFTHRLSDRQAFLSRLSDWHEFLTDPLTESTIEVRDPNDVREVERRFDDAIERLEASEAGAAVVDSLDEMGTMIQDVMVENFLKEVRADVCKRRFVPVFVGRCADDTVGGGNTERVGGGGLTSSLSYVADGVIDLRLNGGLVPETRLKQAGVRRMNAVPYVPQWLTYELTSGGIAPFDYRTETRSLYDPTSVLPPDPTARTGRRAGETE